MVFKQLYNGYMVRIEGNRLSIVDNRLTEIYWIVFGDGIESVVVRLDVTHITLNQSYGDGGDIRVHLRNDWIVVKRHFNNQRDGLLFEVGTRD